MGTLKLQPMLSDIERFELTTALHETKSCEELRFAAKGIILQELQTYCAMYGLINERCIISTDTGLGKTAIAASIFNVLQNKYPTLKGIIVAPSYGITQITEEFQKFLYDAKVFYTNAQANSIHFITELESVSWDLLVLSYEAVTSTALQQYLLSHLDMLDFLVIDESQLLANLAGTTSNILYSMCKQMRFVYMLTATPIRVSIRQFINQMYILDRDIFDGRTLNEMIRHFTRYDDCGVECGSTNVEELLDICWDRYISCTRAEWGLKGNYIVEVAWVNAGGAYDGIHKVHGMQAIKGDMDGQAIQALLQLLQKYLAEGKKGLVYINTNETKKKVQNFLGQHGIEVAIFDGHHTNTLRKKSIAKESFNSGDIHCMITNMTTCLNLDCDFVILYESTFDTKQFIGRGERGYRKKDLIIAYVLVKDTVDEDYFYDNVYKRAVELQTVCGKDMEEILRVGREIEKRKSQERFENSAVGQTFLFNPQA